MAAKEEKNKKRKLNWRMLQVKVVFKFWLLMVDELRSLKDW